MLDVMLRCVREVTEGEQEGGPPCTGPPDDRRFDGDGSDGLPGLFVVGTDTGVGKTRVAAAIARVLVEEGRRVGVLKPVATGAVRAERIGGATTPRC